MFYNNLIFILILIPLFYFQTKFLIHIIDKNKINILSDQDFSKPQAFHENSVPRAGGISIFLSLILILMYLFLTKNILFFEYISFCTLFFLLGLVDDFKINVAPKFRLMSMTFLLVSLIIFNEFYIEKTGLAFLNSFLEIDIFALFFMCLCFLFIINGSNLIDGFNGLLGIHTLIILSTLCIINLITNNLDLMLFLLFACIIILIFLKFNFPQAKIFLGDSGAYLIGALIAISAIKTSILNPIISPFFFCILLFYLFFEVFFSFFRKLFFVRLSPLLPDAQHLHMLLYKYFLKKGKTKLNSNYNVSVYLNLIYFLLIIPGIILMDKGLFCRYYFFFLLIVYLIFYKILYSIMKKNNIV